VANWLVAEHRTQGTMQAFLGRGDQELYWTFEINGEAGARRAQELFDVLRPQQPSSE